MSSPPPQIPDGTWLMFEEFAPGSERSANWRWYLREDGAWFQASNAELMANDDEHWNRPFPDEPLRRFDGTWMARIRAAAATAGLERLAERPAPDDGTAAVLQRWTVVQDSEALVATVARGMRPPGLDELAAVIDEAVAATAPS
jgi:hypothetical protein